MLTEILDKYKDQEPMRFGDNTTERTFPISAVIKMMEAYYKEKSRFKDIEIVKPLAYKTGNWDGKMSDPFLGIDKDGVPHIAIMYEGFLDGNDFCNFYDLRDFGIENIVKWTEISCN